MDDETLLAELVDGGTDVVDLAKAHGMTLMELARRAGEGEHCRLLAALCALTDAQTQLFISRSRATAAGRLMQLTSPETPAGESAAQRDMVRRACVDMLRMELKRVETGESENVNEGESGMEENRDEDKSLSALFYEGVKDV